MTSRLPRTAGFLILLLGLVLTGYPGSSVAQAPEELPYSVDWELATLPDGAGRQVAAILWIIPDQGWHFYARNPGGTGLPTTITPSLLPGDEVLPVHYPPGEEKPDVFEPSILVSVHEARTPFFIPISGVEPGEDIVLRTRIELLLCSDTSCWPVQDTLERDWEDVAPSQLPRAEEQGWWPVWETAVRETALPAADPEMAETSLPTPIQDLTLEPSYFRAHMVVSNLGKAMVFALLAGLILNFMPCVLPVLALKMRAFFPSAAAEDKHKRVSDFRTHNVFFALGILLFFLVLAAVISVTGMAWGQIFQSPLAVLILATVLFALALSLFDVFHLPIIDLRTSRGPAQNPRTEALTTGMLVTLLATPCSGPFLGGVLAWGLLQPPLVIAVVFVCIGIGMASPYILLALFPRLHRYFPRPGNWMIHLERIVGFLILATCIYLLTFLPDSYFLPTLFFLWGAGLGAWVWGKWAPPTMDRGKRIAVRVLAVALVLGVGLLARQFYSEGDVDWEEFTPELFAELHGQENMLLDFTADWCPNCKFLEKTVLVPRVLDPLREQYGLRTLRVDITQHDPDKMALLRKLGSQSIPVVAIFPKGEEKNAPLALRDLFSKRQIRQAARRALE